VPQEWDEQGNPVAPKASWDEQGNPIGGQSPTPMQRASQPTEYEKERDPSNQEGFIAHSLGVLGNQASGLASRAILPYTQAKRFYDASRAAGRGVMSSLGAGAVGGLGGAEGITPESVSENADLLTGNAYKERRAQGYNPVYSALAPAVAPQVGVDLRGMEHQADIGNASGVLAEGAVPAGEAAIGYGASKVLPKISNALKEEPNVAAQSALKPPRAKAVRAQENLETARPYLKGATSLEDLQGKIPGAKQEVWQPYNQAIDAIGDKKVTGPDGPTTVRQLEQERLKTSAQLQAARSMNPTDIQAAMQKAQSVADLAKRDAAIKSVLDPQLQSAGIDPQLIRQVHGSIKGIEKLVEGRNTLTEPDKPFGFGRMANITLAKPRTWIGEPAKGLADIVAGRPLWSGKPTDVAVREGFRVGGEKPDFGIPMGRTSPFNPPARMLPAGAQRVGAIPDTSGPLPQRIPVTAEGTRAQRLGLLLPESRGKVAAPPPTDTSGPTRLETPVTAPGTRAERLGLLLPEHRGIPLQAAERSSVRATEPEVEIQRSKGGKFKKVYKSTSKDND
jgi:hypothetical protein